MTRVYNNKNVYYGLTDPLSVGAPQPIISSRAPAVNDTAEIGTVWIDQSDDSVYTLTSVTAGSATWTNTAGAGEIVASITATTGPNSLRGTTSINTAGAAVTTIGTGGTGQVRIGNTTGNTAVTGGLSTTTTLSSGTTFVAGTGITSTTGNIVASAGNISAIAGSVTAGTTLTAVVGDITATVGDIVASAGDITAILGSISAGTTVTAGTGFTATTGNITASTGNFVATLGGVLASGGNIIASAGDVRAGANIELLGAGSVIGFQPGPVITAGAGIPASVVAKGSLYLRTDGTGTNDRAYIATDTMGTWTAIVTVA